MQRALTPELSDPATNEPREFDVHCIANRYQLQQRIPSKQGTGAWRLSSCMSLAPMSMRPHTYKIASLCSPRSLQTTFARTGISILGLRSSSYILSLGRLFATFCVYLAAESGSLSTTESTPVQSGPHIKWKAGIWSAGGGTKIKTPCCSAVAATRTKSPLSCDDKKIVARNRAVCCLTRSSLLDIWVGLLRIVKVLQVEVEGLFCVKQLVVDR